MLDTIEKVKEFVKGLGVMEFIFISDNVATYRTPIPIMVDGMLTDYEVLFFIDECATFYRMDSSNDFLGLLDVFEVKEVCEELSQTETIYHRKYNSSEIVNSEEDVIKTMKTKFIAVEEFFQVESESKLDRAKRMLQMYVDEEDFENASLVRDKIKRLSV